MNAQKTWSVKLPRYTSLWTLMKITLATSIDFIVGSRRAYLKGAVVIGLITEVELETKIRLIKSLPVTRITFS